MKAAVTTVIACIAIYSCTYVIVRSNHRRAVNYPVLVMPEKGIWKDRYVSETWIGFPKAGVKRPLNYLLYWVYYPAGQTDRLVTGRCFRGFDDRKIIEMP
jgi:hypothetical protein